MPVITSGGSLVTSQSIVNGTIVNEDINVAAGIERKKLADTLLVKATHSVNQTIGTTPAVIAFDTESVDTDSAFSSNTYTAPRALRARVNVNVSTTAGGTSGDYFTVSIRVNGTPVRILNGHTGLGVGLRGGLTINEVLSLALNDTVDILISSDGASHSLIGGADGLCLTIEEV